MDASVDKNDVDDGYFKDIVGLDPCALTAMEVSISRMTPIQAFPHMLPVLRGKMHKDELELELEKGMYLLIPAVQKILERILTFAMIRFRQ